MIVALVIGGFILGTAFSFGVRASAAGTVSTVDLIYVGVTKVKKGVKSVGVGIAQLKTLIAGVNSNVTAVGQKVDGVKGVADSVDVKVNSANGKIDIANGKLDALDTVTHRTYWNSYIACWDAETAAGYDPSQSCWNPNE